MKRTIPYFFVLLAGLSIAGCSQHISKVYDDREDKDIVVVNNKEQVIAQGIVNLNLPVGTSLRTSGIASQIATQSIAISVTSPSFLKFSVSNNNLLFNVDDLYPVQATGNISLFLKTNQIDIVASDNVTGVFVRAYLSNNETGLRGNLITGSVLPLKINTNSGTFMQLGALPLILKTFDVSQQKPINETMILGLTADFTQALSQTYSTGIVLEFVKTIN
ncbi:MAG: hypothetical protein A2X42_05665 [Candidatus Margulisbacteria bacterium GWF2_38_17]|nr:MAG: hypothetical protein A2X42_05665 [Candidatus Margulisbacteria bacterium GWF2_38_17]